MRVFVYGTLKRGFSLHHHLAPFVFLGTAETATRYRLYALGWYPGMVEVEDGHAIKGEVWDVDADGMQLLDKIEEVESGLYERRRVELTPPFHNDQVVTYIFLGDVANSAECGDCW